MSTTPNSGSDAAVDSGTTSPVKKAADVKFTEKEELVLKMAWQCLKSGPPDIDINKLMELCEFKTVKTASNTWGVIKKKLMALTPDTAAASAPDDGSATPKAKATPKKRAKKSDAEADGEATGSPAKKAKATPKKKTPVKVKEEEEGGDVDEEMGEEGA